MGKTYKRLPNNIEGQDTPGTILFTLIPDSMIEEEKKKNKRFLIFLILFFFLVLTVFVGTMFYIITKLYERGHLG